MLILKCVICALLSYFMGCFNAAYLYSRKIKNDDIRKYGSGNAGSTNVLRVYGVKAALVVFAIDVAKGFLAVWLTSLVCGGEALAKVIAAVLVVCGHNWPCFMNYRGGKGVAASLGASLGLYAWGGLIGLLIAVPIILITKMVSLGALCGFIAVCVSFYFMSGSTVLFIGALMLTALTFHQHRGNIKRILNGTESRLNFGEKSDRP